MLLSKVFQTSVMAICLTALVGCQNLPGNRESQGAAIGGVGGAAVGAAAASHHRLLGAIVGGALGAGGGYVIGASTDKVRNGDTQAAQAAVNKAQTTPATPQEALNATTADLNNDGFVTLDEVVAMKSAGLSDETMIQRLRATRQIFDLTDEQKRYLANQGVSGYVINTMAAINQPQPGVLSSPTTGAAPVVPTTPQPAPVVPPPPQNPIISRP
jgi:hypothetical protein